MTEDDRYLKQRQNMVQRQLQPRNIHDEALLEAMRTVPRHEFVPQADRAQAYADRALPIGCDQTISQPYIVALMVQLLDVESTHKVLEVGAGSGYQAAILAELAEQVHAVEVVPDLVNRARRTLDELGYDNVTIHQADGTLGYPPEAPFDRIIVAAAAPEIPKPLVDQLADGGKIVIPVGNRLSQQLIVGTRRGDQFETDRSIGCVFVPLIGQYGWGGQ